MLRSRWDASTAIGLLFAMAMFGAGCDKSDPCSCDDTDPVHEIVGNWECFDAYLADGPLPQMIGYVFAFQADGQMQSWIDGVLEAEYGWAAVDSVLVLITGDLTAPMRYTVVSDTLHLSEQTGARFDYWFTRVPPP